jgi:putative membrane protein (TIGR04086 family)
MLGHTMMITKISVKKKGLVQMNPVNRVNQVRITSPILSGLIYSLIMMAIGTIITSLLLMFTNTQESSLTTLTYIIHGTSLFVGGWVGGKRAGSRGWYYGGMLGIMYSLLIIIVGFLAFDAGLNLQTLQLIAITFSAGALGGILGVNSRK